MVNRYLYMTKDRGGWVKREAFGERVISISNDSGADGDAVSVERSAKSECFRGLYIPSGL